MSSYRKALAAIAGAVATWGATAFATGHFHAVTLFGLLAAVLTALGVYQVPNKPS